LGVLNFLRSRDEAAATPVNVEGGLDAFASERKPVASPTHPAPESRRGLKLAIGVLAAAVLVEAVPTALWLGARFQPPVTAASVAAAAPAVAPPPVILPAAPCEPAPPGAPVAAAATDPVPSRAAPAVAAAVAPGMLAGVITVASPVPMRVYEQGRLVGTTEADRILLTAGRHSLEFVNDSVGYRAAQTVTVQAGQTSVIRLEPPMGTLHVNAVPWAEVWIDNERIGETPIGNLSTRIGTRQLVFRHPELGERRSTVLVTLKSPARVSMDLRNK
jgi:hypothetical protein